MRLPASIPLHPAVVSAAVSLPFSPTNAEAMEWLLTPSMQGKQGAFLVRLLGEVPPNLVLDFARAMGIPYAAVAQAASMMSEHRAYGSPRQLMDVLRELGLVGRKAWPTLDHPGNRELESLLAAAETVFTEAGSEAAAALSAGGGSMLRLKQGTQENKQLRLLSF